MTPDNPFTAIVLLHKGTKAEAFEIRHLDCREAIRWLNIISGAEFAFALTGDNKVAEEALKLCDRLSS